MRDIECHPYAPILMESTRAIGYSIESAIADIIDNSLAAESTSISIYYDTSDFPYIAILDNGRGMTDNELTEAMRYGSCSPMQERNTDDLGRFGLGLKTASLSQCRKLTVLSKKLERCEIARQWDLDHILETKEWSLRELDNSEIREYPCFEFLNNQAQGTLVIWQALDRIEKGSLTLEDAIQKKMDDVKKHLELVFHRYLAGEGGKKIRMYINGIELKPFDPFFTTKSTVIMDDEVIDIPGREGKVTITPYILPHPSKMSAEELEKYGGKDGLRNLQGFYVYRNRRLITWGTWFRLRKMDEFTKLARVKVDIPNSLDDLWTLDIKKSTAYPPEIVKTRLKQLINSMTIGSKRTWTFRGRKESDKNLIHIWDKTETREGIKYEINRDHPYLKAITEKLDPGAIKMLEEYLDTVQSSLPFNNLYVDLNSDAKIAHEPEKEENQRIRAMAKELIRNSIGRDDTQEIIENMKSMEPFVLIADEIDDIYKEALRNE